MISLYSILLLLLQLCITIHTQNTVGSIPCTATTLLQQTQSIASQLQGNIVTIPLENLQTMKNLLLQLESTNTIVDPYVSFNDLTYNSTLGVYNYRALNRTAEIFVCSWSLQNALNVTKLAELIVSQNMDANSQAVQDASYNTYDAQYTYPRPDNLTTLCSTSYSTACPSIGTVATQTQYPHCPIYCLQPAVYNYSYAEYTLIFTAILDTIMPTVANSYPNQVSAWYYTSITGISRYQTPPAVAAILGFPQLTLGDEIPPETIPSYIAEVANTTAIPLPAVGSIFTSVYFDSGVTQAPIVTLCVPVFGADGELRGALNADIPLKYSHNAINTQAYLPDMTLANVYSILITAEGTVVDGSQPLLYMLFCSNNLNNPNGGCDNQNQIYDITTLQANYTNTYFQQASGLATTVATDLVTSFQQYPSGTSTVNLTGIPYYLAYQVVDTTYLNWVAISFAEQSLVDSQAVLQMTLDSSTITTEQVGTMITNVNLTNSGTLPITFQLSAQQDGFSLVNTTGKNTLTANINETSTISLQLVLDTNAFAIGTSQLPLSVTYSDSKYLCVDRYQAVNQQMIISAPYFQYNSALRAGILAILVLTLLLTLVICGWTLWQRQHEVVKRASPNLIGVTCLGAVLLLIACFIQYPTNSTTYTCNAQIWIGHLGFTLLFAPLVLKTWRINRIFNVAQLHVTKISDRMLFRLLGLFLLPPIALLLAWSIYSTPNSTLTDNGNSRFYACSSNSNIPKYILLATEFATLLYTVILCFQIRKSPDQFNEGRLLGAIVYNSTVIGAIAVGVLLAFTTLTPDIEYVIVSIGICIVVNATLLILMVPKLIEVHYNTRVSDIHPSYKLQAAAKSSTYSDQAANSNQTEALFVRTPQVIGTPTTKTLSVEQRKMSQFRGGAEHTVSG